MRVDPIANDATLGPVMADGGRGWQWSLGALLFVLCGVLLHFFTAEEDDAADGELDAHVASRTSASDTPAEMRGEGGGEAGEAPPPVEPPPAFDPTAFAHQVFDGGWGPPEAGLGPPVDRAPSEPAPSEPERGPGTPAAGIPIHVEVATPQVALRRAVFWQDLLDARVAALRTVAESARESGDDARAERTARAIERLEQSRPGLTQRIGELEAEAAEAVEAELAGPPSPGHQATQGPE